MFFQVCIFCSIYPALLCCRVSISTVRNSVSCLNANVNFAVSISYNKSSRYNLHWNSIVIFSNVIFLRYTFWVFIPNCVCNERRKSQLITFQLVHHFLRSISFVSQCLHICLCIVIDACRQTFHIFIVFLRLSCSLFFGEFFLFFNSFKLINCSVSLSSFRFISFSVCSTESLFLRFYRSINCC